MNHNRQKNNKIYARLAELLKQKEEVLDRSGRTPLVVLADELADLHPYDDMKIETAWAIERLLGNIGELSVDQTIELCLFVEMAHIPSNLIADAFRKTLRTKLLSGSMTDVAKRAEILRLVAGLGEKVLPIQLIESETEVRKQHPWHWIDAMAFSNWGLAVEAISETLSNEHIADNLLLRLQYWWENNLVTKGDLDKWIALLDPSGASQIYEWMERRGISWQMPIPALLQEPDKGFLRTATEGCFLEAP